MPEGGFFLNASRFNHSCLPNARYSWHSGSGKLRIYALADIIVGEEIYVTYLGGKNIFGSTSDERQKKFLVKFNSRCLCAVCSMDSAALKASDDRRREAAMLWDRMVTHEPRFNAHLIVADAARGIQLLKDEKYPANADDFAQDLAGICAMHSDWESARYWAKFTYDNRCAEFGEDHEYAYKAKVILDDPRKCPQAGMYSGKKFSFRL
jgi:hypothetical protein